MTLYDEIAANNRVTVVLFLLYALFYAAVVLAAFVLITKDLPSIFTTAILTVVLFLFFYFIVFSRGAQMILSSVGAKEVRKEDYPYLYNTVEGLSIAAGMQMPKVYVIESEAPNAFATGLDQKNSYVVVTTGLLKIMNRAELEGVIAHEISHIRNFDIKTMLVAAVLAMAVAFIVDISLRMMRGGDRKEGKGSAILFLVALFFLILAPIISLFIRLAISRNREYAADASGAMLTRHPPGLASALVKIKDQYDKKPVEIKGVNDATRHLFVFDPKKSLMALLSTHPPINDRIARLRRM